MAQASSLNGAKKATFDKCGSFIVDGIFGRFRKLFEKINDQAFDLVRVDKSKKDWADECNHNFTYEYWTLIVVALWATPATTEISSAVKARVPSI